MTPIDMSLFSNLMSRYKWPKAVAVTGALGSGKTEWVLNLALGFRAQGEEVTIADVDIINPYFCIRQVSQTLEDKGFKVLTAPDSTKWGDLPVITPQVDWALSEAGRRLIMDIGGDAEGALALKQYENRIKQAGYLLILVVNGFRPQTSTVEGIDKMRKRMEAICGLQVGALISNSHLMSETTPQDILHGLEVVQQASEHMDLPILYAGTSPAIYEETVKLLEPTGVPVWPVSRHMLLPWEHGAIWGTSAGIPSTSHAHRMIRYIEQNKEQDK